MKRELKIMVGVWVATLFCVWSIFSVVKADIGPEILISSALGKVKRDLRAWSTNLYSEVEFADSSLTLSLNTLNVTNKAAIGTATVPTVSDDVLQVHGDVQLRGRGHLRLMNGANDTSVFVGNNTGIVGASQFEVTTNRSGTAMLKINHVGEVGVNKDLPSARLHVGGDIRADSFAVFTTYMASSNVILTGSAINTTIATLVFGGATQLVALITLPSSAIITNVIDSDLTVP